MAATKDDTGSRPHEIKATLDSRPHEIGRGNGEAPAEPKVASRASIRLLENERVGHRHYADQGVAPEDVEQSTYWDRARSLLHTFDVVEAVGYGSRWLLTLRVVFAERGSPVVVQRMSFEELPALGDIAEQRYLPEGFALEHHPSAGEAERYSITRLKDSVTMVRGPTAEMARAQLLAHGSLR
jgi:hypothetical protein